MNSYPPGTIIFGKKSNYLKESRKKPSNEVVFINYNELPPFQHSRNTKRKSRKESTVMHQLHGDDNHI